MTEETEEKAPPKKKRGRPPKKKAPEMRLYEVTHKSRIFTSQGIFKHGEQAMLPESDYENHKERLKPCGNS